MATHCVASFCHITAFFVFIYYATKYYGNKTSATNISKIISINLRRVTLSRKTARKATVTISAVRIVNRRIVYCSKPNIVQQKCVLLFYYVWLCQMSIFSKQRLLTKYTYCRTLTHSNWSICYTDNVINVIYSFAFLSKSDCSSCSFSSFDDESMTLISHRPILFSVSTANHHSHAEAVFVVTNKRYSHINYTLSLIVSVYRYIATANLPIIAVFGEYLRQFLIDLHKIYRHSRVPKNTSPCIFQLLSSSGFRVRRRRDFFCHGMSVTV